MENPMRTFVLILISLVGVKSLAASTPGFFCGKDQWAYGAKGSIVHFNTLTECQRAISQAREGFFCQNNILESVGGQMTWYENEAACWKAVESAKNGFICGQDNWIYGGEGRLAYFDSGTDCIKAVNASTN